MVIIDGAQGEGGGQIIRTSLTLSALTGETVEIQNIRANRPNPGLAPQHVTGVHAAAQIANATVDGAALGSTRLRFAPQQMPKAGSYDFDVTRAAKGGSAGSVTLLFQTVWLPLAVAPGETNLLLRGGTHVAWSPPFHYLRDVYLAILSRMGLEATVDLKAWGFYPVGGGAIEAEIPGGQAAWSPLTLIERGDLVRVHGLAVAAELPAHIAQRIANRATNVLKAEGLPVQIMPQRVKSAGPGAGIFLTAEYENAVAGFSALGAKGKPSEQVADEACTALLVHHRSSAPVDPHLADQLLLPCALASGTSTFRTSEITQHLITNVEVIRQFLPVTVEIDGEKEKSGLVQIAT